MAGSSILMQWDPINLTTWVFIDESARLAGILIGFTANLGSEFGVKLKVVIKIDRLRVCLVSEMG